MDNAAQAKKRERLLREKTSVQQELATLVASSGASSAQVISAIGGARGIDLTLSGAKVLASACEFSLLHEVFSPGS